MGEAKRTIIVHAFDDDDKPGGIDFGMSGYGVRKDEIYCRKDHPRHPMKKSDEHTIIFELANRSSVDLRFRKNADDAMWVSADDQTCPNSACHQKGVVFATHVSQDGEQLTVKNKNKDKESFKFALNFDAVIDGQKKIIQFDPIWANQNGGMA